MVHGGNNTMNNIYDAEFHPLIYSSPPLSWRSLVHFFMYVMIIIFIISFTITDLVYGCSLIPCIHDDPVTIPISLSAWFQFSGMIGCMILIFGIAFGCCWMLPPTAHLVINMIPQIMMISWLLLGNVVYWKGYYGNNVCDDGMIVYLMIRFYVGFLIVITSVYYEIKPSY
jgi:hypothetical protein